MNEEWEVKQSSVKIADTFASYYENLYTSKTTITEGNCVDFLKDINLVTLMIYDRSPLEEDLMEEEMGQTIRELQSGKAVGPNGLPVELYQGMVDKVAEHLTAMF
ncbi:hypothetical protein NDU88_005101 [Pleurodeles waltl]|uniref:Uncharacterized protein n=1 Tax=Pleurodeles waltl TaxID=8319 RepID=A0AAV7QF16_PLEWA|nr:hypothetical protein NDU88_005101 [Pleurodeles waltl]